LGESGAGQAVRKRSEDIIETSAFFRYYIKVKYESDIAEMIHENATTNFKLGFISEARMREYDKMCLESEISNDNKAHETENMEHTDLVTA
jgi:chromosomal replication initiation ATPase DnaA